MSINRHNYEEYFILYLDNELDAAGKQLVEAFVQQHPDLKEELDILLQYKLEPDHQIVFEGKEELLKENGQTPITLSNYEEWFTAHVDRELSNDEELQLQKFIRTHPHTAAELQLLLQTRIPAETIVFPGKSSLYRKEEKARRVFPLYFRAAAAVLLILLATATVILLNRNHDAGQPDLAKEEPKETTPAPGQLPSEKGIDRENGTRNRESLAQSGMTVQDNPKTKAVVLPEQSAATVSVKQNKQPVPSPVKNITVQQPETALAETVIKPSNNLPQPVYNPNVLNNTTTDNAVAQQSVQSKPAPTNIINPVVTSVNPQPSDIVQASYADNTALEQADGKKNRNRGIFRKIARTFEKRTSMDPTDDDRLLVAGLSIKLK
jgi:hypothetical protein